MTAKRVRDVQAYLQGLRRGPVAEAKKIKPHLIGAKAFERANKYGDIFMLLWREAALMSI